MSAPKDSVVISSAPKSEDALGEATKRARVTSVTQHSVNIPDSGPIDYTAHAGWMCLYKDSKINAEMFHVAYLANRGKLENRPITFVFNGGPGASSAYLHVGALGPRRVEINPDGSLPKPPMRLVDNAQTWLKFTDLVFVDPIGTGFSRGVEEEGVEKKEGEKGVRASAEFWNSQRDIESLGEFIDRFLTQHQRWISPLYIAGESYGGYRVGRMAKYLQDSRGMGLNGAILISPALDFSLLFGSDYNALYWVDRIPTMAAAAFHHGKSSFGANSLEEQITAAEEFAAEQLLPLLVLGSGLPEGSRTSVYRGLAALIGLPEEFIARKGGRIDMLDFTRNLFRDERKVVGLYDASVTALDPFPARDHFEGGDPTLSALGRLFTGAIKTLLSVELGVKEEVLDYKLLNYEAFEKWKFENANKMNQGAINSTDDLRYGMALNPFMKVFIAHGYFDIVTPYFSSKRLANLMQLSPEQEEMITLENYKGGHMFYSWRQSRISFFESMIEFYGEEFIDPFADGEEVDYSVPASEVQWR